MRGRGLLGAVVLLMLAGCDPAPAPPAPPVLPYLDARLPVAARVDDLLGRMGLDDKVGQMVQAERAAVRPGDLTGARLGSVLSGGGSAPTPNTPAAWADLHDGYQRGALATPLRIPMIYGIDAVHGDNNVTGATIFPHNVGLGATRDPELVRLIGRATAEEVAGAGQDWTFAPCVCVARDARWGRTYESFGSDPGLVGEMTSVVDGLQRGAPAIMATAKHYLGDGGTAGGVDRGDTRLDEAQLRRVHLPPFREAGARGVASVMISYSSVRGVKSHGNRHLVTDVLKGELGFTGFTVSDWAGVDELDGRTGFTRAEVVEAANAGLDMFMVPKDWRTFLGYLRAAAASGQIPMTRIDDANRRILTQKFRFGLFEHPYADRRYAATIGSAAHRALARRAVRESQVLLHDDGVLPLARSGGKIFVAGGSADDPGRQAGGWTTSWQGAAGDVPGSTSILRGIRDTGARVTYRRDGRGIDGSYRAAVAVVGETPYAEGEGDRSGTPRLDAADRRALQRLVDSRVPLVVVVVSGRPMDVTVPAGHRHALLAAWLPGSEGAGVADVLFGEHPPTGRLPRPWGEHPYGYGLTYG